MKFMVFSMIQNGAEKINKPVHRYGFCPEI
jgi:hypothetical protein